MLTLILNDNNGNWEIITNEHTLRGTLEETYLDDKKLKEEKTKKINGYINSMALSMLPFSLLIDQTVNE